MSAESVLSVVTILILVPLCGVIFALTPWLTPKGELFSVSVPTAAASDPRARSLKRAYSLWVLVVTALLTGWVSYVLVAIHPNMAALVSCVAVVVLVLFGYFLMLHYRDKAQDLKQARGWKARGRKSAAVLSGEGVPKPVPLSWELLNLLPIAASIMVAVLGYDSAPDPIPIHAGMDGVVNGVKAVLLRAGSQLELAVGRAELAVHTPGEVLLGGIGHVALKVAAEELRELCGVLGFLVGGLLPVQADLGIALAVRNARHAQVHTDLAALAVEVGHELIEDVLLILLGDVGVVLHGLCVDAELVLSSQLQLALDLFKRILGVADGALDGSLGTLINITANLADPLFHIRILHLIFVGIFRLLAFVSLV